MADPYYADASTTLYASDCLEVLPTLPDNSVDACVTDPPYGLEFMGKDWDRFGKGKQPDMAATGYTDGFARLDRPAFTAAGNPRCRKCGRGKYDRTRQGCACPSPDFGNPAAAQMLAFQAWCELWAAECLRILKPGGWLLAFGGTRTAHRLACAIEDAGFEIRDSIAWLYGSGFPKSLDVSKAIDKRPGVARHAEFAAHLVERREASGLGRLDVAEKVTGRRTGAMWNWEHHQFPEARWWPALRDLLGLDEAWGEVVDEAERLRVGANPNISGRALRSNAVAYGGDHNNDDITAPATDAARQWQGWGTALKPAHEPIIVARKPLAGTVAANVLTYGTGALNIDAARINPGEPVPGGGGGERSARHSAGGSDGWMGEARPGNLSLPHAAGRWPSNVALDGHAAQELDQQSGEVRASGAINVSRTEELKGQTVYSPRAYSQAIPGVNNYADSGGASRFFYTAKASTDERITHDGTAHPTVKPLDLMRWLVRLVTPPGGIILEPFAGSGTTVEAALLEGFRCIAIEREPDYLPLITQRINRRRDPIAYITAAGEDLGLFGLDEGA